MNKIFYSEQLIKDVKKLAIDVSDVTDKDKVNYQIRWYLSPQAHIQRIMNLLSNEQIQRNTRKDSKVLEIGSGIGTSCLIMKMLTKSEVVGAEPAPESYAGLHNCVNDFIECNPEIPYTPLNTGGESIPYPDEYFDFIYSFEVMEHVQDPQKVFQEIYRLLKSSGVAYIATCNYDSFYEGHYKRFWNPFIGVEGNRKAYIKKGLSPQFLNEINFITKKKIRKWIKEIGYSNIEFNPYMPGGDSKIEIELSYPEGFVMPEGKAKSVRYHKFIESPKVTKFLSRLDREYKLYFLLTK